jgi:hypothetical protein
MWRQGPYGQPDSCKAQSARTKEEAPMHADIARRLARRPEAITTPFRQVRRRCRQSWPEPLDHARAPEETYRDYMFRTAIWH